MPRVQFIQFLPRVHEKNRTHRELSCEEKFRIFVLKTFGKKEKAYQVLLKMTKFLRFRIKESKKSSHQDRHSSSVDRSLSPRLEGKSFYDGGSRGTPPSMAIQAGIKPHSSRELQYNNKKKKKG